MFEDSLLIQPEASGLKLIRPQNGNIGRFKSLKEALESPINIFIQRPDTLLACNENTYKAIRGEQLGFYSQQEIQNVSIDKVWNKKSAAIIQKTDTSILKKNSTYILEEEFETQSGIVIPTLSFKFPCYSNDSRKPFIFGISIILDQSMCPTGDSLAKGIKHMIDLNLLPSNLNYLEKTVPKFTKKIEGVYITRQQYHCLKLASKGMTAKMIGAKLQISHRTVERHFENLKHRLNVKSKYEMLTKVCDYI